MSSFRSLSDAFGFTTTGAAAGGFGKPPPDQPRTPAPVWPHKPAGAKPSEPETPAVLVAMVVDRSGSMQSMGVEVAGGCNAFLDGQREADTKSGTPTHLIFSVFDDKYDVVRNAPLAEQPAISPSEIIPRGMTALYDALGRCLDDATEAGNKRTTPFEKVIIFVLTDGQENSSHKCKKEDITLRIKRLETEFGWEFYFAAANQDAMATGSNLGFKGGQCVTFDSATPGACEAAFKCTSNKVAATRGGDLAGTTYTQEERDGCL